MTAVTDQSLQALMVVSVLLILCAGGLIGLCALLVVRLTLDRKVDKDILLKMADRMVLSQEDQLARLNDEAKERVAIHHIDASMNGQAAPRGTPERPIRDPKLVMDSED